MTARPVVVIDGDVGVWTRRVDFQRILIPCSGHQALSEKLCDYAIYMSQIRIITDPAGLGRSLSQCMRQRSLTQQQLATGANVNQSQVSRVLNGDVIRLTNKVERICKYANIDFEEYLEPIVVSAAKLERLARMAGGGVPERERIVGQVLTLLAKLR